MGNFREDLAKERLDIEVLKDWLQRRLDVEAITEATAEEQIENDIDFHGYLWSEPKTFEAKIRKGNYDDLLIETLSNSERGTLGWIYTSQADILAYFFVEKATVLRGLLIYLAKLKDWWTKEGKLFDWPKYYGTTGTLYHTENRAVPISAIPADCILLQYGGERATRR